MKIKGVEGECRCPSYWTYDGTIPASSCHALGSVKKRQVRCKSYIIGIPYTNPVESGAEDEADAIYAGAGWASGVRVGGGLGAWGRGEGEGA